VVWNSGEPSLVLTADGEPVDEVTAVSGDGKLIGGDLFDATVSGRCCARPTLCNV
jgi:hypothetical protein